MKLISLLCLFFAVLSSSVSAQNVQFRLDGKVAYIRADSAQYKTEFSGFFNQYVNDSVYLQRNTQSITTRQKKYSPKIAYELNGRFLFPLSDKLSVSTGLGFRYISFELSSDIVSFETVFLSEDTIRGNIEDTPTFSVCDRYENDISDLGEIKRGIQQDILNLTIPVKIHYNIVPNLVSMQVGAYFQTPIYSLRQRESIQFHRETVNDQTVCHYEKIEERNTAGNGIRNLQLGGSVDIEYLISPQLSFEIGIRKNFSNVFVDTEFQQHPFADEVFKSLALNAGVAYIFGKETKSVED